MKKPFSLLRTRFLVTFLLIFTLVQVFITFFIVRNISGELDQKNRTRAQDAFFHFIDLTYEELEAFHQGFAWWEDLTLSVRNLNSGEFLSGDILDSWSSGNLDKNTLAVILRPEGITASGGKGFDFWNAYLSPDTYSLLLKEVMDSEEPFHRHLFIREGRVLLLVSGPLADDSGIPLAEGTHFYGSELTSEEFTELGDLVGGKYESGPGGFPVQDSVSKAELFLIFTSKLDFSAILLPFAFITIGLQSLAGLVSLFLLSFALRERENLLTQSLSQHQNLELKNKKLMELGLILPQEKESISLLEMNTIQLSSVMKELKKGSENLNLNNAETHGRIDDTYDIIQDTHKKIFTITEHIHNSVKTIEENAENARNVLSDTEKLKDKAENFGFLADELNQNALEGTVAVRDNTLRINEVGNASDRVLEILKVISDISERTHLLAINAAIEASRAGNQGKGFGVVATEIRSLSDNVAANTREIEEVVKNITTKITEAVTSTERVGKLFNRIADQSDENLDLVENIREIIFAQTGFAREMVMENNLMVGIIKELESAIKEHIFGLGMIENSMGTLLDLQDSSAEITLDYSKKFSDVLNRVETLRPLPEHFLARLKEITAILGDRPEK